MNYNILVTSNFKRESKALIKKYHSLKNEIDDLIEALEKEPDSGTHIGKNCYKIRLAIKSKGKGKSGGARVISLLRIVNEEVHLLSIYDKSAKETISQKEIDFLLKEIDF